MVTYYLNRDHINPRSEEHAAQCHVSAAVQGDWQDAKSRMAEMVIQSESDQARAAQVLFGLVCITEPGTIYTKDGLTYTGTTWTVGDIVWSIREV